MTVLRRQLQYDRPGAQPASPPATHRRRLQMHSRLTKHTNQDNAETTWTGDFQLTIAKHLDKQPHTEVHIAKLLRTLVPLGEQRMQERLPALTAIRLRDALEEPVLKFSYTPTSTVTKTIDESGGSTHRTAMSNLPES